MPEEPRDYEKELAFIQNGIAESIAETPADVLWTECREAGMDVKAIANQTKNVIATAISQYKQRHLQQVRHEYETRAAAIQGRSLLSEPIEQLRELLVSFVTVNPQFRGLVTAQFRDLSELSDTDVRRILSQLQELDALNGPTHNSNP
jgi:hypothetical protein